jgi:hypothetical protein
MLVGFVMPDGTASSSTRSSMSGHVTGDSPDYGTFDAALGICRGGCSDNYS